MTPRRILVTGATSHLGMHVVPRLIERYGTISCFVRPTSNTSAIDLPGVRFVEGDLRDSSTLETALAGCNCLVSVASIRPFAKGVVQACKAANVKRAVVISTTSVFTSLDARDKRERQQAEEVLRNSGLDVTILRPTMIYGTPYDRNMSRLLAFLRWSPVVPIPGSGRFRQQPVHVDDVAAAIVDSIEVNATIGQAYNLSGAKAITHNELVDLAATALGVKRVKLHLPISLTMRAIRLLETLRISSQVSRYQVLRLNQDKCFDHSSARRDFGFSPRAFPEGIAQQCAIMDWTRTTQGRYPLQSASPAITAGIRRGTLSTSEPALKTQQ